MSPSQKDFRRTKSTLMSVFDDFFDHQTSPKKHLFVHDGKSQRKK